MTKRSTLILWLMAVFGCATPSQQTYQVEFGVVELPNLRVEVIPKALPVDQSRTISLDPSIASNSRSAQPVRTIAVVIVPSGRGRYTEQIIYYPPEPPKRIYHHTGSGAPPAWVVTKGLDLGKRTHRGPVTIPVGFTEGDPPGTWRVKALVNGEEQLDETFELTLP